MKTKKLAQEQAGEAALGVVVRGLAAGFAGTLLLSLFSRLVPWLRSTRRSEPATPGAESVAALTPADALALASGPSPEGAAERFALKLGSGLFGRDLAPIVGTAGLAVHVVYGSFWGGIYGLLQSSLQWSPGLAGLLHGLAVWTVGPGWLVPAMRLMRPPDEQPPATNLTLVAGHVLYGLALSRVFELLRRRAP